MAGLLVQRDRRVIMGVLDWLPVKFKALPREETSAVVAGTDTHSHSEREYTIAHVVFNVDF